MNILIIEDDLFLASSIKSVFQENILTNRIKIQSSYIGFLEELNHISSYDVVITDIVLSETCLKTGIDVLSLIRKKAYNIPIVIMSSLSDYDSLETAFKLGANDYIIKPFRLRELEIRINKWFHDYVFSVYSSVHKTIEYHELIYYIDKSTFVFQWVDIPMPRGCKYLLSLFVIHSGKVLSEKLLIEKIWWDYSITDSQKNIRIQIMRLKNKLQPFWLDERIKNIRGEWYIFEKI